MLFLNRTWWFMFWTGLYHWHFPCAVWKAVDRWKVLWRWQFLNSALNCCVPAVSQITIRLADNCKPNAMKSRNKHTHTITHRHTYIILWLCCNLLLPFFNSSFTYDCKDKQLSLLVPYSIHEMDAKKLKMAAENGTLQSYVQIFPR